MSIFRAVTSGEWRVTSATSITPGRTNADSGRGNEGLIFVFVVVRANVTTSTTTPGYSKVAEGVVAGWTYAVFTGKPATATAHPVITWSGAATAQASVHYFEGTRQGYNTTIGAVVTDSGTGTSITNPGLTTTAFGSSVFIFAHGDNNVGATAPGGYIKTLDGGTTGMRLWGFYTEPPEPSGSASGSFSATIVGSATWISVAVELLYAPPPTDDLAPTGLDTMEFESLPWLAGSGMEVNEFESLLWLQSVSGLDASEFEVLLWLPFSQSGRRRPLYVN